MKTNKKLISGEYQRILHNAFHLLVLQGANYILPLILLPYFVRVLGIETYGRIAFTLAIITIFRGVVAYGFELTGTKQIAVLRDQKTKLVDIYSAILMVKLILMGLCFCVLLVGGGFIGKIEENYSLFLCGFLLVIGDLLFPVWFFQGIEKMQYISIIRISHKVIYFVLVLLLVNSPDDFLLVPFIDGVISIVAGGCCLYLINKKYQIKPTLPSIDNVVYQMKNGWSVFVSRIAVVFYTSFNVAALGFVSEEKIVGYYTIAEKIYMAARGLFSPFLNSLFPFLSKKYHFNKKGFYLVASKIFFIYVILTFLGSMGLYFFSEQIVYLVSGTTTKQIVDMLNVFAFSFLFCVGPYLSGMLVIKGEHNKLLKVTIYTSLINILFLYFFISEYGAIGIVYLFFITQLFQCILQIKYNSELINFRNI